MNSEFLGARGSNAGDDYHELWAARHAIRLLGGEGDLQGLTVEGVSAEDENGTLKGTWEGVDCSLSFGSETFENADRIVIEQLKYSASSPDSPWSVARLTSGKKAEQSVAGRLARAWHAARGIARPNTPIDVLLISNQPLAATLHVCVQHIADGTATSPWADGSDEHKLWKASGLSELDLQAFCQTLKFELGAGSRFASEERVMTSVAAWTESDIQNGVLQLLNFVRQRMRPEHAGKVITRDVVMVQFGAISADVLLPCPPALARVDNPVKRPSTAVVSQALRDGKQYVAMHGQAGVGKTTALQEIEADLPEGSAMIVFDCYGGGTFMDPSALRHRPSDAYVQLINQTAIDLGLPLLLRRSAGDDLARLFKRRLVHAADAVEARAPGALLVIAIDAADNAILAAESRAPYERAFVLDFVQIASVPDNVRFIVSARTSRLSQLELPASYEKLPVQPFDLPQTAEFVLRRHAAGQQWLQDFHDLTSGIPRVQSYALDHIGGDLEIALDRLRPAGKDLNDVFNARMEAARIKSGSAAVDRMCARLIILPRPVPVNALSSVAGLSAAQVLDICGDLAPGVRIGNGVLGFADEDFEDFLRRRTAADAPSARGDVATWMWSRSADVAYAAIHVAEALLAAGRGGDLLELADRESSPSIVTDPVIQREVEIRRLRLAIQVCNSTHDIGRALQFVLRGAEGMKTEAALRKLLLDHQDMAAAFAYETVGRLLLSDGTQIDRVGGFLFQRLAVDAELGDATAVREGKRRLRTWLDARDDARDDEHPQRRMWPIGDVDIAAGMEAVLVMQGPEAALRYLRSWTPWTAGLAVALTLPTKLVGMGRASLVESICANEKADALIRLFCAVPLALSGRTVASAVFVDGLTALTRRRLKVRQYFLGRGSSDLQHSQVLRLALFSVEMLVARGETCPAVERLLEEITATECRQTERHDFDGDKLDLMLRAFLLRELLANRELDAKGILIPKKPDPEAEKRKSSGARDYEQERQEDLQSLVSFAFPIYLQRARAIFNRSAADSVGHYPSFAAGVQPDIASRLRRRQAEWPALLSIAAVRVMELAAIGYSPSDLKKSADAVHWPWVADGHPPSADYVAIETLSPQVHEELAADLISAAGTALARRSSASQKCADLIQFARLLRPISPRDANSIFNQAVEVASHIDAEALVQIQLLGTLVGRGAGHFISPASIARNLQVMVVDARIRLDGYDDFPWQAAVGALASLNGPRALADVARWDDDGVVDLRYTLPELLHRGLDSDWLPLEHAAALSLLDPSISSVMEAIAAKALATDNSAKEALAEAAAHDALLKDRRKRSPDLAKLLAGSGLQGPWCSALLRQEAFVDGLPEPDASALQSAPHNEFGDAGSEDRAWRPEDLADVERLKAALESIHAELRANHRYASDRALLKKARSFVPMKCRRDHLEALRSLALSRAVGEASWMLVDAVDEWKASPAVLEWAKAHLPQVISANLTKFVQEEYRGQAKFAEVVALAQIPVDQVAALMLKGIEANVSRSSAEKVFQLVGVVAQYVEPGAVASLADWYIARLADKVPPEVRVMVPADADYPVDIGDATARTVFAYLGDVDLRARWRAAHAVRRLADLGALGPLRRLISMYPLKEVKACRSATLPFYWLAARLWFVMAWERIALERPAVALESADTLLAIALDDSFPHLLVRASARDACSALMRSGWMPSLEGAAEALDKVNQSQLPRLARVERPRSRRMGDADDKRRFNFNEIDTKPYWYEPMLRGFADVDMDKFTGEAEKWIIDIWGFTDDLNPWVKEPRKTSLERFDWSLTSNNHGSLPTVERIKTHLEWHAMWCAAGSLLKTEPLPLLGNQDWYDSQTLESRVQRYQPGYAPIWSADLARPTPLTLPDWRFPFSRERTWHESVEELDHRAELMPADRPDYLAVYAHVERRSHEYGSDKYVETITIWSALADPRTSCSLLRALQTMRNAWDYRLPHDGDDDQIDDGQFRLMGWLKNTEADSTLDEMDALVSYALRVPMTPGAAVTAACNLVRDPLRMDRWTNLAEVGSPPMFLFETWGKRDSDARRYRTEFASAGSRLLVHREQLARFLDLEQVDLIVEVEVERDGATDRQLDGEEDETRESQFDRLYRLRSDGSLDVAEGHLGTWTGDRP